MTSNTATHHPFSHLGPAPYRFLGTETVADRQQANNNRASAGQVFTTNMCGGSCDHCGTAIMNVYRFQASDGAKFKVGSTCCEKARKEYPVYDAALEKAAGAVRSANRKARHAREAGKLIEADNWIKANVDVLAAIAHPRAWAASQGQTMLDSLRWTWDNAGTAGKLKAYRVAVKAVE